MSSRAFASAFVMFVLAGAVTVAASEGTRVQGAQLTVEISGLERLVGQVRIAVFDCQENWLGEATYAAVLDVEESALNWAVEDVPKGEYGIVIFHDVNANGVNDRNLFGIPSEPYGFSNNYRVRFGPPKWAKAKFQVSAPETTVRIRVK